MQLKYRLFRRGNGIFYSQDNESSKQGSLRTTDKREAERLLNAMNESHREPSLNLNLARAYLAAHDPKMAQRTWQAVMDEIATHGIPSTQVRCARGFRSRAYDAIRNKPLVQTTGEDLLAIIHANGNCLRHYLRRLHNLALDLGWLPWPVLAKKAWPKIRSQTKRAISAEEHIAIVVSEQNNERRAFLLTRATRQRRRNSSASHRAAEFRRRCRVARVSREVSLHSYRHSWAERAKSCGYPERFAQQALGHSSRAVHEAYARAALVVCPALDEFEAKQNQIIQFPGKNLPRKTPGGTARPAQVL